MNLESFQKKESPKFENLTIAFKKALQEDGLPISEVVRAMKTSMLPEELIAIGQEISKEMES